MSFIKSISDIFRPTQQVTVANQPPMAQQNPAAGGNPPPPGTSLPNAETTPPNPLDGFSTIWQTDPKAAPTVDPLNQPLLNPDPVKMREAASKLDFVGMLPKELVSRVHAGNDPAAIVELVNAAAQAALAQAAQLSTATVEHAGTRLKDRMLQSLPGRIRDVQIGQTKPSNSVLEHPAAQPMLHIARAAIATKNPHMSPAEINAQAEAYLQGFAEQLISKPETDKAPSNGEYDWDAVYGVR